MSEIHHIFPTPVYIDKIEREFTKKELSFVKKLKETAYNNAGNQRSKDSYLLDKPEFKKLKKDLMKIVENYFKEVLSVKDITPYITQSWINWTNKNQWHHRHSHANSYVSGVLYLAADEKVDKIEFHRRNEPIFLPRNLGFNMYNTNSWWFGVTTGLCVLFPSTTIHEVMRKSDNNERISLAFNVFFKGILGDNFELTELKI